MKPNSHQMIYLKPDIKKSIKKYCKSKHISLSKLTTSLYELILNNSLTPNDLQLIKDLKELRDIVVDK